MSSTAAAPLLNQPVSKQALFLSPLERWIPTWNLEGYVSLLERAGYRVDLLFSENVSISFLRSGLANYDIIILRTDSFSWEGFNYYCSGDPVTFEARSRYAAEVSDRQLHIGACVGFSFKFIQSNYPANSLRAGMVFVMDGYSAEMSSVFLAAGSAVYVGYYDGYPLVWGRMDALSLKWLSFLSKGYPVKTAVPMLYNYLTFGHGDTGTWPSLFWYGDGNFKL